MKELEKTPLENDDVQIFYVTEDEAYIRNKGESKFTNIDVKRAEWQEHLAKRESSRNESSILLKRRVLDLRNKTDYETALEIVDSLIPSDEDGFYEVLISADQYDKLRRAGVRPIKVSKKKRIRSTK